MYDSYKLGPKGVWLHCVTMKYALKKMLKMTSFVVPIVRANNKSSFKGVGTNLTPTVGLLYLIVCL